VAAVRVGPGIHHVTLSAVRSAFGDRYEVAEAKILDPAARRSAQAQLSRALAARGGAIAYSFSLADVAKWSWPSLVRRLAPPAPVYSRRAWKVPYGASTVVTATSAPRGGTAPQFSAPSGRSVYAVAELRFRRPQDWARRPYIYLEFRGDDSGEAYEVSFDSGAGPHSQARYTITDDSRGWRTLGFPTSDAGPGSGRTDWSRVRSVRVALPSKSESGTFALSVPRPSRPVTDLRVPLPIQRGARKFGPAARKPDCVGGARSPAPRWLAGRRTLVLPVASLHPSCSLYGRPRAGYRQLPATAVTLRRTGTESWSYSFSSRQPGVLVWTQGYDPLWMLSGTGRRQPPLPVLSLLDGYFVGAGQHSGRLAFVGGSSTRTGVAVSVLTLLALLALGFLPLIVVRWRRRRRPEQPPIPAGSPDGEPGRAARPEDLIPS
jgi:hypothetical protein